MELPLVVSDIDQPIVRWTRSSILEAWRNFTTGDSKEILDSWRGVFVLTFYCIPLHTSVQAFPIFLSETNQRSGSCRDVHSVCLPLVPFCFSGSSWIVNWWLCMNSYRSLMISNMNNSHGQWLKMNACAVFNSWRWGVLIFFNYLKCSLNHVW